MLLCARPSEWFTGVQAGNRVLGIDVETTRHYADIRLELQNAGTPIPMNDLWIAAIARQHKQPILSRDPSRPVAE